ncbi:MAG: hypothetical protein QXX55_01720 [Candidatus Pacearchaeota archaeon]
MNKWVELSLGLILLVGMIFLGWGSSAYSWELFGKDLNFLHAAWIFLKGALFWTLFIISIILIIIGINDLRE